MNLLSSIDDCLFCIDLTLKKTVKILETGEIGNYLSDGLENNRNFWYKRNYAYLDL